MVIEQVKNKGYKIENTELYNKEFNSSLLVHFPHSGCASLLYPGAYLKLGPIDFTLGDYKKVFEDEELINEDGTYNYEAYQKSISFRKQKALGKISEEYVEKFNYNYDLWLRKGRHDLIDFFNVVLPIGMESAFESASILLETNYTDNYDSIFQRNLPGNVAPMIVYEDEEQRSINLVQRIFIDDYYCINHMLLEGCWNENEWKYLNSEHLTLNGVKFGTKEWIKESCKLNNVDEEVFKGKTINFYIFTVFGLSGYSGLIHPKLVPIFKDIRF